MRGDQDGTDALLHGGFLRSWSAGDSLSYVTSGVHLGPVAPVLVRDGETPVLVAASQVGAGGGSG
ncbi:hypothetical protein GCM10010302_31150 [Streptomyces polychromogenes]|uniref:Uncharacterized protein n=1 Tax=Streptomyces polychromogenes TaxID=67342 RepID=A0ABP3F124_9ACTN